MKCFIFLIERIRTKARKPAAVILLQIPLECHSSIGFTPYVARNLFQPVSLAYAFRFHDTAVKRLNRYNNNNNNNNKYEIYYIIQYSV